MITPFNIIIGFVVARSLGFALSALKMADHKGDIATLKHAGQANTNPPPGI